jgi:hypothetical protein
VTVSESGEVSTGPNLGDLDTEIERVKDLEDEICRDCLEIVGDVRFFAEIDPDEREPPEAWVKELGLERAKRRHRVARASWMATKDAPVAISVAKSVMIGAMKVRALERAAPRSLNIAVIMPVELPNFEVKDLEEENRKR